LFFEIDEVGVTVLGLGEQERDKGADDWGKKS
jgi:hypothetical protein